MNETSIETSKTIPFRDMYEKQRDADKLQYSRKLAEIDYMLFVIEWQEVFKQAGIYQEQKVSDLKVLLAKRIMTFAHAEEHRDYSFQSQHTGRKYPIKW